ncbi:Gfo/Idh/MocA family protein [Pseudoalteromonas sp. S16_S37]|uniref:Gfo/Idh/MocA family protein n=1 Tax=Pseudoalteromonas sp. S16_S37 TaxID=2720228 RepID=UPI0016809BE7|nr:Gfo/Idh/MocA family oxidoreductase [Pseudoalteromonas sp. S16_S37]MBD1584474.1 Gfo/Idh/MocA family oxidoreductase [Pseudoalteromonas sp. S16_S37]
MGMVGGGPDAFIGAIHRMAAALDGEIELVCGAFSANELASVEFGKALGLASERSYGSYQQMFIEEAQLPKSQRMDFVVIVTPNHLHFPVAKMALNNGFHVLSDKPATLSLAQALELELEIYKSELLYGLTHAYASYPLIKQAKELVNAREFGTVKKVIVEYTQGWLAKNEISKQAQWRLDPKQSGISCCMGDIGVHAAHLAEYVSGLAIEAVCAELNSTNPERSLDDDGCVLLKFHNGASGVLIASQVAVGDENNLTLKVYGEHQSIEWSQLDPNTLFLKSLNRPTQIFRTGSPCVSRYASDATRLPAGHPEGYIEAFANIYKSFAQQIRAHQQHKQEYDLGVPGIREAIRGMAFIESVVFAARSEQKWHPLSLLPQEALSNE